MFLSPAEIKQQQLREKRGAYEREDVDALIDNVIGSYQHVWLERDRLKARVDELEGDLARTKELEQLLRDGLASAQRAAEQVKEEAEQQVAGVVEKATADAEKLLAEARAQAEEIVAESRETRDKLEEETTRLERANHDVRERYKAFLQEALAVIEGTAAHKAVTPEQAAAAKADESAPVAEPEELEAPVGWLATVPLTAVATDEVAESIEHPEPAAEPVAEEEPAAEPEEEEEEGATVLLSAVAQPEPEEEEPEPEPEPEPVAAAEEDEPTDEDAVARLRVAEPEPEIVEPEPEPEAETAPEPEPEPQPEPAPAAAEPEPEPPEEEPFADEAYMTFRSVPAVKAPEPEPAQPEAEGDEPPGEDAYEDWSPKKS